MVHRESRKKRSKKTSHRYQPSLYELCQILYKQITKWLLYLSNICKNVYSQAYDHAVSSQISENWKGWTKNLHYECATQLPIVKDDCVRFAFFNVVKTEHGMKIKTLSYEHTVKR